MAKNFVVVFSDAGARILKGIRPDEWRNEKNALINPTRPLGIPPHLWVKNENGTIGVIDQAEYNRRNPPAATVIKTRRSAAPASIKGLVFGEDSVITPLPASPESKWRAWDWLVLATAAAAVGGLIYYFTRG